MSKPEGPERALRERQLATMYAIATRYTFRRCNSSKKRSSDVGSNVTIISRRVPIEKCMARTGELVRHSFFANLRQDVRGSDGNW